MALVAILSYGRAEKIGIKESEVTILQMGGTPGVAQGLESGRIEVGVLGDSGMLLVFRGMAAVEGRERARNGLSRHWTRRLRPPSAKSKPTANAVLRFMQAYLETIHYFQTNKSGQSASCKNTCAA